MIGVLKIGELQEELSEKVEFAVFVAVNGIPVRVARLDDRLPAGGAAIMTGVKRLSGFIMFPDRTFRLYEERRIQADLLMSGRAEMVMGKNHPQSPVFIRAVEDRIGKPPLNGCSRPVPFFPSLCIRAARIDASEKGVRLRSEADLSVRRRHGSGRGGVVVVDRLDPLLDRAGREGAVFIVPPVTRSIR